MTIKHLKVSAKADGPDPGNVHASDWNAIHDLSALVIADITDSGLTGQALVRTNTVAGALTQLTIPNHNLMAVTAGGKVTIGADPVNPLDVVTLQYLEAHGGGDGSGGGSNTTVNDTPPTTPAYGDRWIKPSNMAEMVWVPNAGTPGVWINPADAAIAAALSYPIPIDKGGTGATTASGARTNLGAVYIGGDTMTGNLVISTAQSEASLRLDSFGTGHASYVYGTNLGVLRWRMALGDTAAETGSNFGSNFNLYSYTDTGTLLAIPLAFSRATGLGVVAGDPTTALGIATKQYVDTKVGTPLTDAPDATTYGRKAGAWVNLANHEKLTVSVNSSASLTSATSSLYFSLNKPAGVFEAGLAGVRAGLNRWGLVLGNAAAESTGNAGSDFALWRYDDAGVGIDTPLYIPRASGLVQMPAGAYASRLLVGDGTVAAPSLAWNSAPTMGWTRSGTGRAYIIAGLNIESVSTDATSTYLSLFPPVDNGNVQVTLHDNRSSQAPQHQLYLRNTGGSGYVLGEALIGGATGARPMNVYFPAGFNVNGPLTVTSYSSFQGGLGIPGGPTLTQDANYSYVGFAANWYFVYEKANGNLHWHRDGGGADFLFRGDGVFTAPSDAYFGTQMSLQATTTANSQLWFTSDGWKLLYGGGVLYFQTPGQVNNFYVDGNNGNVFANGKFATSGQYGTHFTNAYSDQYIALGDPGFGSQFQLSFTHVGGVWAGIKMLATTGQFQFDYTGVGRNNAGGSWGTLLSDVRSKQDIVDYTSGLDAVLALRPRIFSFWPETGMDPKARHVGLIAQEAQLAMPDIVEASTITEIGDTKYEYGDLLAYNPSNVLWALVNAIKTLHERINQLELQ